MRDGMRSLQLICEPNVTATYPNISGEDCSDSSGVVASRSSAVTEAKKPNASSLK